MAQERGLRLRFGPKKGKWLIEADEEAEKRLALALIKDAAAGARSGRNPTLRGPKAASQRALDMLKIAVSARSSDTHDAAAEAEVAPQIGISDPRRAALPLNGYGREQLQEALASIQPIQETDGEVRYLSPRCTNLFDSCQYEVVWSNLSSSEDLLPAREWLGA
jgi:hypothetical protein